MKALGQYVRRNLAISSRTLANKLLLKGINVSYVTVLRHLAHLGYDKKRPLATPMLTTKHKEKRIEWAQKHINDNWNRTLFTDETLFWLFRNTIEYWYKDIRPFLKTEPELMSGAVSVLKERPVSFVFAKS